MTNSTTFDPRRRAVAAGLGSLIAAPGLLHAQAAWKPERPLVV